MIDAAVVALLTIVCVLLLLMFVSLYYLWKQRKRLLNLEHNTNGGFSSQHDTALRMDVTSPYENVHPSTVSHDNPPSLSPELDPYDSVNAEASDPPEIASASHTPINNVYWNMGLSPFTESGQNLTLPDPDVDYVKPRTLPPIPVQDNSLGTKTLIVTAVRLKHPDASIVSMRIFLLSPVSAESLSDTLEVRNVNGVVITKEPVAIRPLGKSLKVAIDCIHGGRLLNPDYSAQVIDFNLAWAGENPSVTFHFKANNEAIDTGILVCKLTVLQDDQPLITFIDLSTCIAGKVIEEEEKEEEEEDEDNEVFYAAISSGPTATFSRPTAYLS